MVPPILSSDLSEGGAALSWRVLWWYRPASHAIRASQLIVQMCAVVIDVIRNQTKSLTGCACRSDIPNAHPEYHRPVPFPQPHDEVQLGQVRAMVPMALAGLIRKAQGHASRSLQPR